MSARGRGRLLLLAGLFIAPLLLATWLYQSAGWRPRGSAARGELVQPPRSLPRVVLPLADGSGTIAGFTAAGFLHATWSAVYFADGPCEAACRAALADLRQVRLALDKDASRLQRVLLYAGDCCDADWLAGEQAGLVAAALDGDNGARLRAAFADAGIRPGEVALVDPLGNLMMKYRAGTPAPGMLKDLERLPRLSQIG